MRASHCLSVSIIVVIIIIIILVMSASLFSSSSWPPFSGLPRPLQDNLALFIIIIVLGVLFLVMLSATGYALWAWRREAEESSKAVAASTKAAEAATAAAVHSHQANMHLHALLMAQQQQVCSTHSAGTGHLGCHCRRSILAMQCNAMGRWHGYNRVVGWSIGVSLDAW